MLMSFKPRWAGAILSGEKSVELRRQRSGCEAGTPIVIYASHPVMEVQGVCEVAQVVMGKPDDVWEATEVRIGVTRAEFDAYLAGCGVAYGIVVQHVRRLRVPFALGFRAPQSFRYLHNDHARHARVLREAGLRRPSGPARG